MLKFTDIWIPPGNAKTDGLEDDLHFRENDYSIMLSVFCTYLFSGCF